jgi:hypothetical protein
MTFKPSNKKIFESADYWNKLTEEEKQWLYEFELMENYAMAIPGRELDEAGKKRQAQAEKAKKRRARDYLDADPETIKRHHASRIRKSSYGPEDYNLDYNEENSEKEGKK